MNIYSEATVKNKILNTQVGLEEHILLTVRGIRSLKRFIMFCPVS